MALFKQTLAGREAILRNYLRNPKGGPEQRAFPGLSDKSLLPGSSPTQAAGADVPMAVELVCTAVTARDLVASVGSSAHVELETACQCYKKLIDVLVRIRDRNIAAREREKVRKRRQAAAAAGRGAAGAGGLLRNKRKGGALSAARP